MAETPPTYVPPAVRRFADDVAKAIGRTCHIDRVGDTRWRVYVQTDAVYADATWALTSRRVTHVGSKLTVHGKRREPVSLAELKSLLDHPDGVDVDLPPLEAADPAGAPAEAQTLHDTLAAVLDRAGCDVTAQIGTVGGTWTVDVSVDARNTARVAFEPAGGGYRQVLTLVIDGKDRTSQAGTNIEAALALLLNRPQKSLAVARPPVDRAARAARTNSVEVRRQTVRRV